MVQGKKEKMAALLKVLWKVLGDKGLSSSWVACLEINMLHFRCIKWGYRVKTNGIVVLRMRRIMFCLSAFIDQKWSQFLTNKCQSHLERDFNKVTRSHEGIWRNLCRSDFLQRGQPATCVFLPKYFCGIIVFFDFPRCVYPYNNKRGILGKMNGNVFSLDQCHYMAICFWFFINLKWNEELNSAKLERNNPI